MTTNSEQWHLTFVRTEPDVDGEQNKTTITAIEKTCIDSLNKEKYLINEYYASLRLVKAVQLNIYELLESVVHYAADFLETSHMDEEKFDEISLNFSRQFLNILGMFRSFLDHSDHSISRDIGKDSTAYKAWKAELSNQFDSSFEYRFFYKLRNYCQHIGMPPMNISYTDSVDTDGISFRLDLARDQLLADNFSWGAQLAQDIAHGPEKISVLEALNKWGECFKSISIALLQIKREVAIAAAKSITSHRTRLGLPQDIGKMCAIKLPNTPEKLISVKLTLAWLPEEKAKQLLDNIHINEIKRSSEAKHTSL